MQSPTIQPSHAMKLPYLVAATFFMEYLDTTIIATALPQMAETFGVGPNEVSMGMTAYMLALAVFIPISGWIADRFGSRTVFCTAIIIFTLASVLCGLSTSVETFTFARIIQGIGGALMVPVGRLIVVRNTEKSQLMQAISTITWPAIAAPVVGPPIGGFITTYASWEWIFLINVPFGIAALIAAAILVPNERSTEKRPLDVVGFLLSGATLTAILYGTELASQHNANVWFAISCVAAGLVLGVMTYRHASNRMHPLIDYSTLKVPTYSVTVITGSLTRIGIGAVPYLMPLIFQIGFGLSAFHSGLLLLASAIGNFGMKAFTSRILQRWGFRTVCIIDVFVAAGSTIACGFLTPTTPLFIILVVVFIYGLARSMQFTALATLAYADIPQPQMSTASTLWSAANQMTTGMGIAFGALSLQIAAWSRGGTDSTTEIIFTLQDFQWAFAAAGILTLISLPGYLKMSPDAGSKISGTPIKSRS